MNKTYEKLLDKVLDVLQEKDASPMLSMGVIAVVMTAINKTEEEDRQQGDA